MGEQGAPRLLLNNGGLMVFRVRIIGAHIRPVSRGKREAHSDFQATGFQQLRFNAHVHRILRLVADGDHVHRRAFHREVALDFARPRVQLLVNVSKVFDSGGLAAFFQDDKAQIAQLQAVRVGAQVAHGVFVAGRFHLHRTATGRPLNWYSRKLWANW